jgi:hypothetical protein
MPGYVPFSKSKANLMLHRGHFTGKIAVITTKANRNTCPIAIMHKFKKTLIAVLIFVVAITLPPYQKIFVTGFCFALFFKRTPGTCIKNFSTFFLKNKIP